MNILQERLLQQLDNLMGGNEQEQHQETRKASQGEETWNDGDEDFLAAPSHRVSLEPHYAQHHAPDRSSPWNVQGY